MFLFVPCLPWPERLGSLRRLVLLLTTALLAAVSPLWADDPQADSNVPVVVINVASVERLLNQALVTFESAGRPELAETLGGALERVNNLKGFDRNESVGVMIYLNGLMPEVVGYVPVKNFDEVLKTIEIGPITTKKTGEDRFEIVSRRQTFYGKVQADYAFIANSASALDREFRDPAGMTARLSRAHDLAASFNLKSIPPPTRDLFLSLLRAKSESDLQRRDNEPVSAHRLRKAAGLRNIELIEELLLQGKELTIGWSVSASNKTASLEIAFVADSQSELATYFNELEGVRSRFAGLLSAKTPLTASLSWKLGRPAKKMFQEMISAVEIQWMKDLGEPNVGSTATEGESPQANPVRQLVQVLRGTTDAGHLDLAFQFIDQPSGSFVLVGGLKVADAPTLSTALTDIFTRLKENEALSDVRLNALSHQGISFHRLEFKQDRPQDERLYGGKPGLHVGVGDNVLWLALGGDDAPAELKRTIDKAAEPVAEGVTQFPLQFVMNFASWMDVFDPEKKPDGFAALARSAFAKGGDSLRIEALPIDGGLRLKITMDEAFLRLVGQQIAKQIDASQE
jgi:hypothetical protein